MVDKMNERIRELALQASEGSHYLHTHGEPLQKFARLLVQECIEAIRNESMNSNDEWEDGLQIAENAIREYFGVKS